MKKIIEVSTDSNIGGAGRCILTYLENYDREKYEVLLVVPVKSLLTERAGALGIRVIEVSDIAEKSLSYKGIKALKKVFSEEKPDLVHTHASMSARIAAKLLGIKIVYTRHSVFPPSPKISKGIGKVINGFINNFFSDKIIAVAEAAKDNLTDTGVSDKKITVVLNGVDALTPKSEDEKSKIRQRFGVGDSFVVSIIARLEDIKGHDYFIDAADILIKRGMKAKFVIAGTGSYESHLKEKVEKMGLQNDVLFTGFITDVDSLMNITDLQANASYGTEATSLSLLEGMSLGIPAVVSDFGGNPGVIKNGKNGFLFPEKNAQAMADAIYKVYSDNELYNELSCGSKKIFNETFTAVLMTRNIEKVYDLLLD